MRPDFVQHLIAGTEHFNARRFWDAHEAWEAIWLHAHSDVEQFLQGLIQIAAAYHHLQRGTFRGGVRLFDAGLRRVSSFPDMYCGVDRREVVAAAVQHREWADQAQHDARLGETDYPKFSLASPSAPSVDW